MEKVRFFQLLAGIIAVATFVGVSCSNPSGTGNACTKPAAPTGVSASALSTSSIRVTWALVGNDASYYNVYRARTIDGAYSSVGKSFGPPFTDTALTQATEYYYKITAVNDCGEGAMSAITKNANATTMSCQKPPTPTNITAIALNPTSIKVSWDSIPVAVYYEIYRAASIDGTYGYIDSTTARTYTNTGLTVASTHYYKIVAKNDCGESDKSNYASATTGVCPKPAAPANAKAEAISASSIKISWDMVTTAVSYKVYRSEKSTGTYLPVGNTSGNSSVSYTDADLVLATTYYYKVVAESECEESEMSIYTFAETMNCSNKPAAPTNITAQTISQTEVKVSWDKVSSAKYYNIYEKHSGLDYYMVTSVNSTYSSYTISNRNPGITYNFKVSAKNDCGESAMSTDYATATTEDCDLDILPNPTNLSAEALSSNSVKLTWNEVSGAVEYIVYRGEARSGTYHSSGGRITSNSYTDITLSSSTTYYYAVKPVNECGKSGSLDNVVSVTTMCETSIPVNVNAEAKPNRTIEISWSAVSGAVQYTVYRATSLNGSYTSQGEVTTTMFTDDGLTGSTAYYYKVTAKTATCDVSRMSATVTATTTQ